MQPSVPRAVENVPRSTSPPRKGQCFWMQLPLASKVHLEVTDSTQKAEEGCTQGALTLIPKNSVLTEIMCTTVTLPSLPFD